MRKAVTRIGIVGCGTAGQAASVLLARAGGVDVTLFEKFHKPVALGAGMLLQPTGCVALDRLGLMDDITAHGARVDRLYGSAAKTGRTVLDLSYNNYKQSEGLLGHGIGIHRSTLFHLLHDRVQDCTGGGEAAVLAARGSRVQLKLGVSIVDATHKDTAPVLIDADGGTHGPFDLVIVAEGSASALREKCCPQTHFTAPVYPWGAFWTVLHDTSGDFQRQLSQVYDGCSTMIGILPIGRLPQGVSHDGAAGTSHQSGKDNLVSFFWSVKMRDMDSVRGRPLEEWKAGILRQWPKIDPLLSQVTCWSQLANAKYRDVLMRRWHHGKVLFLGDAAHGTSPQLGQGANMALIDALVLGDAYTRHRHLHPHSVPDAIAGALADYQASRFPHLLYYQTASRLLTPVFQSDSRVIGAVRDACLGPMCAFPLTRTQMLKTLVGMQSGVLGTWAPPARAPVPVVEPSGSAGHVVSSTGILPAKVCAAT